MVLRNGKEFTCQGDADAADTFEFGDIGVLPDSHPLVGAILPDSPAEKAGLKTGDVF